MFFLFGKQKPKKIKSLKQKEVKKAKATFLNEKHFFSFRILKNVKKDKKNYTLMR